MSESTASCHVSQPLVHAMRCDAMYGMRSSSGAGGSPARNHNSMAAAATACAAAAIHAMVVSRIRSSSSSGLHLSPHLRRRRRRVHDVGVLEERGREITLARVRQHRDDALAHSELFCDFERGPRDGAGGDADEQSFFFRQSARNTHRVLECDVDDLIDDARVVDRLNETGADALNLVRAVRAAFEHRRLDRLDGNDADLVLAQLLLEDLSDARHRASGADARDDRVDASAGVAQNLARRRLTMDLHVRGIVELPREPRARRPLCVLAGDALRFFDAGRSRREDQLRAERLQKLAALDRERVRHDQHAAIAFRRRDERESDAGVAARRLDDRRAGPDLARLLRLVDHRDRDAILHRRERVERLELRQYLGRVLRADSANAHERRVSDELRDVVVDPFRHLLSFLPKEKTQAGEGSGPCFAANVMAYYGPVSPQRQMQTAWSL